MDLFNVWQDALETRTQLSRLAGSLKLCSHPELKVLGYRAINFKNHRYVMLYRLDDTKVYVDAVYHQLQDYEHIFAEELSR